MSKINSIEKLNSKIDTELAWRKQDLTGLKFDVDAARLMSIKDKERRIKSGIVLLYSHWEGAIKNISDYYLEFVSNQGLKYSEIKPNFLTLGLSKQIDSVSRSKKSTLRNELITKVLSMDNLIFDISTRNIISADSNLNSEVFKEITATIGVPIENFETSFKAIDEKLLQNRNFIAHGENFNRMVGISEIEDYIEIHEIVVRKIDDFAQMIMACAEDEDYKK